LLIVFVCIQTEYVDGFLQVLQWLQLADLRWMSAVSKHWRTTCAQHCAGLQAIRSQDVMPRPPESHHKHPAPEGMHGFGFWVPSVHFTGKKSFGSFKCECGHAHMSAESLPKYPQGCKHCEAEIFPCCLWYNDYDFWQESEPVTWRRLDVLHWSIRHATHPALTRIDVGSSLPFGWRLPRRLISSLSTECVSLQHLCLQGMHVPQEVDFWYYCVCVCVWHPHARAHTHTHTPHTMHGRGQGLADAECLKLLVYEALNY
jgi:hypothetical protein